MTSARAAYDGGLRLASLSIDDAARMLDAAGGGGKSAVRIRRDLEEGAPQNQDGTINLVHYAAWLAREVHGA